MVSRWNRLLVRPIRLARFVTASVTFVAVLALGAGCSPSTPAVNENAASPTPSEGAEAVGTIELADITLSLEKVVEGFDQPLYVTSAGDASGRLFVVEKTGRIWIVRDGQKSSAAWLDISKLVSTDSERGLLGLAFAPDFADSGQFYVDYTDLDGNTHVARFTAEDHTNDTPVGIGTEQTILTVDQPFSNHNGGMVTFGPDGYLYIGLGDGGSGGDPNGNGQNTNTLLGSILRIDVNEEVPPGALYTSPAYTIPRDNPFVDPTTGEEAGGRREILAWGLRNPWRFSFDRETGDLWIGDVGQNLWEEVDFVSGEGFPSKSGYNFGWNLMEGEHAFPPDDSPAGASSVDIPSYTAPLATYGRDAGQSVTGGYVYRGSDFPELDGVYFFGDFGSGRIWGARPTDGGERTRELLSTGMQVVSFGEDDDGELYVVDFGGALYRLIAK